MRQPSVPGRCVCRGRGFEEVGGGAWTPREGPVGFSGEEAGFLAELQDQTCGVSEGRKRRCAHACAFALHQPPHMPEPRLFARQTSAARTLSRARQLMPRLWNSLFSLPVD